MYADAVPGLSPSVADPRSPLPVTVPPRPGLIRPLTSVRLFAALHVAVYHMVHPAAQAGILAGFVSSGYAAVSFFFMLSGFILTYTSGQAFAAGKIRARDFLVARFARIYPVYLVCTLLSAYVYRTQFHPRFHAFAFAADLLMVQSWSIRMASFFNVPGWSLSAEAFFYVLFPLMVVRLRPGRKSSSVGLILLMWFLALLAPTIGALIDPTGGWNEAYGGGHNLVFAIRRYPIFFLPVFAAGIVLGWFHLNFRISARQAQTMLAASLLLTLAALWISPHLPFSFLHNGLLLPLYAAIILGLCYEGPIANGLSWKPFLLLGEASYAMYLFHYQFNDLAQSVWHVPESLRLLPVRLAVVVPVSLLLYIGVERPCRRLIMRGSRLGSTSPPTRATSRFT